MVHAGSLAARPLPTRKRRTFERADPWQLRYTFSLLTLTVTKVI
jgi:hypothetical protein